MNSAFGKTISGILTGIRKECTQNTGKLFWDGGKEQPVNKIKESIRGAAML